MPAKSRRQQKWAFGVMGERWARAHHFDELAPSSKKSKAKPRAKAKAKAKRKRAK